MKFFHPQLGFNNNVRHKGRVFHIQTEDSGVKHPHIITHLFADGGRILKSTKTSYAEFLEEEELPKKVRALMQEQHKAMFIALRAGKFDGLIGDDIPLAEPPQQPAEPARQPMRQESLSGATDFIREPTASVTPPPMALDITPLAPVPSAAALGITTPDGAPAMRGPMGTIPTIAEGAPAPASSPGPTSVPESPPKPRPPSLIPPPPKRAPPPAAEAAPQSALARLTPPPIRAAERPSSPPPPSAPGLLRGARRASPDPFGRVVARPAAAGQDSTRAYAPTMPHAAVASRDHAPPSSSSGRVRPPPPSQPSAVAPRAPTSGAHRPPLAASLDLDLEALELASEQQQAPVYKQVRDLPPPPAAVFKTSLPESTAYRSVTVSENKSRAPAPRAKSPVVPAEGPRKLTPGAGRYAPSRPAAIFGNARPQEGSSIFGEDLISEKSLDEVILSYLAEDLEGGTPNKK
jgi:hypothetical protein